MNIPAVVVRPEYTRGSSTLLEVVQRSSEPDWFVTMGPVLDLLLALSSLTSWAIYYDAHYLRS